jgi:predicted flap endonuclease-1-like 5' DNA nuclease
MNDPTLQTMLLLLATGVAGTVIGWLIRTAKTNRNVAQLNDEWQTKLDDLSRERDRLITELTSLRSMLESQQADIRKHEAAGAKSRTELESAQEKEKLLSKSLFTLRAEREDFKNKIEQFQNALVSVNQQAAELQTEFIKSSEFYKGELTKAFEKRKALEVSLQNAKLEHESFSNHLQASQSEQEAINKMLASAKNRLADLDILEEDVIRLQAENAQLRHDASRTKLEIEVLQRDVAELDELKDQNQELTHCLNSIEASRKQYEDDAKRHRQNADQTEQKSETLQVRLDEVERNFADIENRQRKALRDARIAGEAQKPNGQTAPQQEHDDLKIIVGIGKKFEQELHDLGVYSYRQIANFEVADIARVNMQLKEFKGRMEQDDWIGQAKELLFKKYG